MFSALDLFYIFNFPFEKLSTVFTRIRTVSWMLHRHIQNINNSMNCDSFITCISPICIMSVCQILTGKSKLPHKIFSLQQPDYL